MIASKLAATILFMLTVYVSRDLQPVYLQHLREAVLGPEAQAQALAEKYVEAATHEGIEVAELAALGHDESGQSARRESPVGALGRLQLLPRSKWGRAWKRECEARPLECEWANVRWGAVALREALEACCGVLALAYGFYRTGKCIAGPRARRTVLVAEWIRWRLQ